MEEEEIKRKYPVGYLVKQIHESIMDRFNYLEQQKYAKFEVIADEIIHFIFDEFDKDPDEVGNKPVCTWSEIDKNDEVRYSVVINLKDVISFWEPTYLEFVQGRNNHLSQIETLLHRKLKGEFPKGFEVFLRFVSLRGNGVAYEKRLFDPLDKPNSINCKLTWVDKSFI